MNQSDLKILLVEDEPMLQYVFEQQMKKLGFQITTTTDNGKEAVEHVLTGDYNLVFMDVRLPVLDGLSATQQIRTKETELGLYTPIVGLTAFAHRGKCLRVGMDDFLQKPITSQDLREVMDKWSNPKRKAPRISNIPAKNNMEVKPEEFEDISDRLKRVKQKIAELRQKHNLG